MSRAFFDPNLSNKKCKKCGWVKHRSLFRDTTSRTGTLCKRPECMDCGREYSRCRLNAMRENGDFEMYVRQVYTHCRSTNKRLGRSVLCTFSEFLNDFKRQFELTGGRCPKTGIPYKLVKSTNTRFNPDAPSPDQIIPANGYSVGNIQWVSQWYNMTKSDLAESDHELRMYQYAIKQGWVTASGE